MATEKRWCTHDKSSLANGASPIKVNSVDGSKPMLLVPKEGEESGVVRQV